ncbi:MAG TPA: hypothetical protein VEM96_05425 [Pyrinomonadaceae bacterium]|nr:hypothetical protein [Pyrinomonadaceae bacterium]
MLYRNRPALLERGYFYPQAGCPEMLPGQHNLAWEISGDRRYQDRYGTIDDLIREVKDRSDDVILSSEDFECSLYNTSKFSSFISLLHSCGFLITVIPYVRNQIDYLPRIYLTLLLFGLDLPFARVLGQTLDKGEFRWREWIFNFDYCDVLTRIGKTENVNVVVRSYEQARMSVCSDFLSIFNLTLRDLHVDEELFENVSLPLRDYLLMFLHNRMGRKLLESEERVVNNLVSQKASRVELSPVVRLDLFQRFRETNRNLFIQYGIPEPKLGDISGVQDCSDMYIDELFSENIEACLPNDPTAEQQPQAENGERWLAE